MWNILYIISILEGRRNYVIIQMITKLIRVHTPIIIIIIIIYNFVMSRISFSS
jgi:hypothetical protein